MALDRRQRGRFHARVRMIAAISTSPRSRAKISRCRPSTDQNAMRKILVVLILASCPSAQALSAKLGPIIGPAEALKTGLISHAEALEHGAIAGPVEADETYMGGRRKNMSRAKRSTLNGRGTLGKSVVVGMKDRGTNEIRAQVVASASAPVLQGFVREHAREGAVIYTDEASAYAGLARDFDHAAVNHSVGEYVREQAHTNVIESFWSMLKRAHKGTFHKISPKHLDHYVTEFAGRHNVRDADTVDQMVDVVAGMGGKRLRYNDLIADNGLDSGARA